MPALIPTDHYATITWLGKTADRDATLTSVACDTVELTYEGVVGEARSGLTRSSCPRVTSQYPLGTEIRNVRQLSVLSAEELAEIAADLKLEALDPTWLGASMVLAGLPDFTHLPPSARLQADSGAVLVVDMENQPCNFVSREVERARPGHGIGFKPAAKGKRGVTAWVEHPGVLKLGDQLRLHLPGQRAWQPGR
ncbi:MOSC domain-containing protein [Aliiroseovarius sp. M344]|uniref:MOSC domain-containing protein n=1 Tax=Aliiroseovarius sp. M344 TaxID=2867010 RepID=UPI0021AD6A69|nr:MOSC domain-containing protein [Aliiroseovarius sp. M344]UWQ13394.1 MOSC domain-containing protein [Aliiroseovarius sp. M344]